MSAYDKLIAEGQAKGRLEGKLEGKAELLLRQLQLRFGALPPAIAARVRSASAPDLDAMADRVLTAENVTDVVG